MTTYKHILLIDDDIKVLASIEETLKDAGYKVTAVNSAEEGSSLIEGRDFDAALLDIWMPGEDGISILKRYGSILDVPPIIIMSGHANISTAVAATKYGAFDILEKPFEQQTLLRIVDIAVSRKKDSATVENINTDSPCKDVNQKDLQQNILKNTFNFEKQNPTARGVKQRTLKKSAVLYGQGLHSGVRSGLTFQPLPENSGIHFVSVSSSNPAPAHFTSVTTTGFATSLKRCDTEISTIEHLMAALWAYGITNLLIKCNKEIPVLDGSSLEFCALFDEVGILEQDAIIYEAVSTEAVRYEKGEEWIEISPSNKLEVEYELRYPQPLGVQKVSFVFDESITEINQNHRVELFKKEIAQCRTFGFLKDLGALQARGLALGGRFDNCVLVGEDGPLNTQFRIANEPARHKVLDMLGDLYLAGKPIRGKINACMTGHADNVAILKKWFGDKD